MLKTNGLELGQGVNRDTIWFRAGLSLSVLWLLWAAYAAYSAFTAVRAQADYPSSSALSANIDECSVSGIAFKTEDQFWQYEDESGPTPKQITECVEKVRSMNEAQWQQVDTEYWADFWDAALLFGLLAFVPIGILLTIIGYWSKIAAAGSAYVRWLRQGSSRAE